MNDIGTAELVRLDDDSVRRLATLTGESVVVSCYLDVDGRRRPRWTDVEQAFVRLARRARGRAGRLGMEGAVERDLEAIGARLGHGLDRSAVRGLALFSGAGLGPLREVRAGRPVRDQVAVDRYPRVAQLEEVLAADVPFVVALADRQRCRLFLVRVGEVHEVGGPHDEVERSVDVDRELGGFARHEEEALRRHLRRSAEALRRLVDPRPGARVLLAGTDTVTAELERYLDATVRPRLAGRVAVPVTATAAELATVVADVERGLAQRRAEELVERLRQLTAAERGGVVGLEPTLEALEQRRVATLLVSRQFEAWGGRCGSCGWFGPAVWLCPRCGNRLEEVDDVVELAVDEALAQKAEVVGCDHTELDRFGRIGAVLRF